MPTCRPRAKSKSAASLRRLTANLSADVHAKVGLEWVQPNYTFATPVLGGQVTVGMGAFFGRNSTDLAGTLTTTLGPLVSVRSDNISSSVSGFGDLYPIAMVKWHDGVNNYMVYATGDIPVGAYDPNRLANLGDRPWRNRRRRRLYLLQSADGVRVFR